MIPEIAQFILALSCTVCLLGCLVLIRPSRQILIYINRRCLLLTFVLLGSSLMILVSSFVDQDLTVATVAGSSHHTLPLAFKISASWGNHEGSLLLFAVILSLVAMMTVNRPSMMGSIHAPLVGGFASLILLGFTLFCFFLANPFERLNPYPDVGQGLNPILQDGFLAFHPPIVYLGYSGLTIAFCFALALLIRPHAVKKWALLLRPVVLFAWSALLSGIFLGALWAYRELGWGGYWFWDPVENASLMPWLTATALFHVLIIVSKRQLFTPWAVLLSIAAFAFCLIAFFIVRSGLLISVHSFADNAGRGLGLIVLFGLVIVGSTALFAWRGGALSREIDFHPVSRESGLIIGSMILFVTALLVLLGTLYPLLSEIVFEQSVAVGAPWFNRAVAPLLLLAAVMSFITPLVSWKKPNLIVPKKRLVLSLAGASIASFIVTLNFNNHSLTGFALWLGLALSLSLVALDVTKTGGWPKPVDWGRAIAHAGVAVLIPALIASTLFARETGIRLDFPPVRGGHTSDLSSTAPSDLRSIRFENRSVPLDPNRLTGLSERTISLLSLQEKQEDNYLALHLGIKLRYDNTEFDLFPERRRYVPDGTETMEVGSISGLLRDIQITFDPLPFSALGEDSTAEGVTIRIVDKPFVIWVWIGGVIIILGGLCAMAVVSSAVRRRSYRPASETSA